MIITASVLWLFSARLCVIALLILSIEVVGIVSVIMPSVVVLVAPLVVSIFVVSTGLSTAIVVPISFVSFWLSLHISFHRLLPVRLRR